MASPPFLPDEAKPGASDLISLYPAVEQTFRDIIESWLLIGHDTSGNHKSHIVDSAGGTNAVITEDGIDRNSASSETFEFQNSGAGDMTLLSEHGTFTGVVEFDGKIQADDVVTTPAEVVTSSSNAVALSMAGANKATLTLDENTTITVSGEVADQVKDLWIKQGSTGGTAAWSGVDQWVGGSAPTLSTTAGQRDLIVLSSESDGSTIIALHIGTSS